MADELKPCAHCGEPAELDTHRAFRVLTDGRISDAVAIYCTKCSADMTICRADHPGLETDELVSILTEEWNRRSPPDSREREEAIEAAERIVDRYTLKPNQRALGKLVDTDELIVARFLLSSPRGKEEE